jgi:hypothetical protein
VQVSPLTVSSVNGPSQCPGWPVFPSLHTRTSEFRGRSWISLVRGPLRVHRASVTCRLARILRISAIALLIAAARCITIGAGGSDLAMRGYTPKTSRVGTSPLGLAVSLRALKAICSTISLLIPGSSTQRIW